MQDKAIKYDSWIIKHRFWNISGKSQFTHEECKSVRVAIVGPAYNGIVHLTFPHRSTGWKSGVEMEVWKSGVEIFFHTTGWELVGNGNK